MCLCHLTFLISGATKIPLREVSLIKMIEFLRFNGLEFKSTGDRYYKNNLALINKFLFLEILSFHKIQQQNNVILQRAFCIASVRRQCNYLWKILK